MHEIIPESKKYYYHKEFFVKIMLWYIIEGIVKIKPSSTGKRSISAIKVEEANVQSEFWSICRWKSFPSRLKLSSWPIFHSPVAGNNHTGKLWACSPSHYTVCTLLLHLPSPLLLSYESSVNGNPPCPCIKHRKQHYRQKVIACMDDF